MAFYLFYLRFVHRELISVLLNSYTIPKKVAVLKIEFFSLNKKTRIILFEHDTQCPIVLHFFVASYMPLKIEKFNLSSKIKSSRFI
jgi:hypothetical protein